jgi:hypothetical protein
VQKSRKQAQQRKTLEQEKARLEREREERWTTLYGQVAQEVPSFVEEVAQNLEVEAPFLRTRYETERTAMENYQKSVFFAAHVNEKLKLQYPERFTAFDQEYIEKVTEIDRKLLAL